MCGASSHFVGVMCDGVAVLDASLMACDVRARALVVCGSVSLFKFQLVAWVCGARTGIVLPLSHCSVVLLRLLTRLWRDCCRRRMTWWEPVVTVDVPRATARARPARRRRWCFVA